jgi:STAS domain
MHALLELSKSLRADGVRLVLSNPSRKVTAQLRRGAVLEAVGTEWVFVRTADAVAACLKAPALSTNGRPSSDDSAKMLAGPPGVELTAPRTGVPPV